MPRSRSMAIQSEVTPRRPALPCTAPAWLIADACSASASVRVDLPASGWLITANVRRREASSRTAPSDTGSFSTSVTDTAAILLTPARTPDPQQEQVKIDSPERPRGLTPHAHDSRGAGDPAPPVPPASAPAPAPGPTPLSGPVVNSRQ